MCTTKQGLSCLHSMTWGHHCRLSEQSAARLPNGGQGPANGDGTRRCLQQQNKHSACPLTMGTGCISKRLEKVPGGGEGDAGGGPLVPRRWFVKSLPVAVRVTSGPRPFLPPPRRSLTGKKKENLRTPEFPGREKKAEPTAK